jgi:hypothetical protein
MGLGLMNHSVRVNRRHAMWDYANGYSFLSIQFLRYQPFRATAPSESPA